MSFSLRAKPETKGAGQVEENMGKACEECAKYSEYLDTKDPCVCHATDIMGTFENDATKTTTARIGKKKKEVKQTGAERLPEGWHWHCRPITDSKNPQGDKVWEKC